VSGVVFVSHVELPTLVFFFFFSSRRRHTRFSRDWSSDVCSSDLLLFRAASVPALRGSHGQHGGLAARDRSRLRHRGAEPERGEQIGRASCRERVEIWVGAAQVEKKSGGE